MDNERGMTARALLTGMLLGGALTPSNVYSGLKIGWSFNMSIIALLLGFGLWRTLGVVAHGRPWTLQESNINQTAASSAASIISGGLVAPIPAYTLLTGHTIAMWPLMAWVFSVSFLGIWVAWFLRPSLIAKSELQFPVGMATLETMNDIFGHGREAVKRISVLFGTGLFSAGVKWIDEFAWRIPRWTPTDRFEKFTFNFDPSLLLIGFGGIIGIRVGLSLFGGALLAWGIIAPWLIQQGYVAVPANAASWFSPLVEWLIWPGVTLMVCCTLTSFIVQVLRVLKGGALSGARDLKPRFSVPVLATLAAVLLAVVMQVEIFNIPLLMAVLAVPLAVVLASVAARVVGETGIPPIGAIGKVSQLSFGIAAPGQIITNLMTANAAGGAAGQCADLLNDFKVGHEIKANPASQAIAQAFGILAGSIVGVLVYLVLIPNPDSMLLTAEWPAPAVATWKAVAEALSYGLDSIPVSVHWAVVAAAVIGILMGLLETALPPRWGRYLPSAVAVGLAFVIPASTSMLMALGALLAWLFTLRCPGLARRFVIAAAAGLVAGESIVGVAASFWEMAGF